jgi:periplasmic protein CpxP/Spy
MLKHCFIALTLAALACMGTAAIAQDSSNTPPAQSGEQNEHWHGRGHMDPEKRTEMLTKHLSLTSDQQPKVLEILKSEQSQMQSLHSDSSLSQEDRRSKAMDIHKSSNDQIRALLTPDQQKKFDEMQSRHEHEHGNGPAQ